MNSIAILVTTLFLASSVTATTLDQSNRNAPDTIQSDKNAKKRFSIPAAAAKTKVGGKTTVKVQVNVAKGWKWNEQYPAKLTFTDVPEAISLPKLKYSQMKGDFKSSKEAASVGLNLSGKKAGKATVVGNMKFSVCNETSCVIEKAPISVVVAVQ